jgi:uncharacterized protein DUF5335
MPREGDPPADRELAMELLEKARPLAVAASEIPRPDWSRFLDEFSRAHRGWLMTVEEESPEGRRELVREVPLSGVSAALGGSRSDITIIAGPRETEWTHRIDFPAALRLKKTPDGAEAGIEADSAGGMRTTIRFRSAVLPETVDGMLPEP